VMVLHFVSDTHNVKTMPILCVCYGLAGTDITLFLVTLHLFLEFSLQLH
jgi:hypothetical protein